VADPACGLVENLSDRKLEPVAPARGAHQRHASAVGRPRGIDDILGEVPGRSARQGRAPQDAPMGVPDGAEDVLQDQHLAGARDRLDPSPGQIEQRRAGVLRPRREELGVHQQGELRHRGGAGGDSRGREIHRQIERPAERGGILTQGAILTVTSYPTRTSPVLRGKWILENVLGSPPPPPPPDVPNLQDSAEISAKDLRKALEQHRASPACASCHVRLDPLGFSLEKYDATGRFRNAEGGGAIDDSGVMPGGTKFSGAGGLKQILLEHRDEFVECLSEKLLTYALGRGLEYYDLPAVREIRRKTGEGDHRFSALALAIVDSVPFQMRRSPER